MKIAILMSRRLNSRDNTVMTGVMAYLAEWGVRVDVIHPEEEVVDLSQVQPEHDLYILKSATEMALGFAGVLHAAGANIINPFPVSAFLRDRISVTRFLMSSGIPVPESFVTAHPEQLGPLLSRGPLAIKSYRGSGTKGLHVVWDEEDLDDVPSNQGPVFAQRFIERKGRLRKVYVIGEQVFGVDQRWPARSHEEKEGKPFTVGPKLREIARRCGKALGIEIFGLDIVGEKEKNYVVDVRGFPGFRGVPEASLRLADYFYYSLREGAKTAGPKPASGPGAVR